MRSLPFSAVSTQGPAIHPSGSGEYTSLMHVLLGTTPAALRSRFNRLAVRYVQDEAGNISQI